MSHLPPARCRHLLVALLAGALLAGSTRAQDTDPASSDDFSAFSLEELLSIEVTVEGASRRAQSLSEAPASVTIVTRDEIRRLGHRSLSDVLAGVRSFDVTDDRNYEHLGVRGFNPLGDFNSRVLLLVDGHRVNNVLYDSAAIGLEFPVDIGLVERVEVIRGPGSALYGSNAFFAVVNVITRRGADVDGVELTGGVGSQRATQGAASWGLRLDDGGELLVSADFRDDAGASQFYPEYAATPSGGHTSGTDGENSQGLFASWQRDGFSLQAAFRSRNKGIPTSSYGTVFDQSATETRDDQWYLDAAWRDDLGDHWSSLYRFTYDGYAYDGDYIYDYADPGDPPFLVQNQDDGRSQEVGVEAVFTRDAEDGHVITVGGELREALAQDQRNADLGVYLDDTRSSTRSGLFGEDAIDIGDDLDLVIGARIDHTTSFPARGSPRAALIWGAEDDTTFKLVYGQAYRVPNAYERYYHDGYSTQKPNPDLDPETISALELIWEQRLDEHLQSSVSVYRYRIDDLVTQVTDPSDGLLQYVNAGSIEAEGLELELDGKWESGWSLRASQAWQDPRDGSSGAGLTNAPSAISQLSLVAPLVDQQLFAGLALRRVSERRTLGNDRTAAVVLADVTLSYESPDHGWDIAATLRNLLDDHYDVPGGGEHIQDRIRQDGRTLMLRATHRF